MRAEYMLIPCMFGIVIFLILFLFLAFVRYLHYKEILTLAEKGLAYPERKNGKNGKDTLRWGILITAIGLALIVGLLPAAWGNFWPLLLIGLLPTFFGLGLVLIYVLTREQKPKLESEDVGGEAAESLEE
ncbi:MAG: hypothetical protein JXA78_16995 [Anaerolineales bacterium]|nr:hypothetical protein [Anaerolineales bacterium]